MGEFSDQYTFGTSDEKILGPQDCPTGLILVDDRDNLLCPLPHSHWVQSITFLLNFFLSKLSNITLRQKVIIVSKAQKVQVQLLLSLAYNDHNIIRMKNLKCTNYMTIRTKTIPYNKIV